MKEFSCEYACEARDTFVYGVSNLTRYDKGGFYSPASGNCAVNALRALLGQSQQHGDLAVRYDDAALVFDEINNLVGRQVLRIIHQGEARQRHAVCNLDIPLTAQARELIQDSINYLVKVSSLNGPSTMNDDYVGMDTSDDA